MRQTFRRRLRAVAYLLAPEGVRDRFAGGWKDDLREEFYDTNPWNYPDTPPSPEYPKEWVKDFEHNHHNSHRHRVFGASTGPMLCESSSGPPRARVHDDGTYHSRNPHITLADD